MNGDNVFKVRRRLTIENKRKKKKKKKKKIKKNIFINNILKIKKKRIY